MYILTRSRVRTDPNIYMILYMYMCESVCVCIYSPVLGYELIPTYMILYMYMCESVCVCIYSPVLGYELIPTYI